MSVRQHCDHRNCDESAPAGPVLANLLGTSRHALPDGWGYVMVNVQDKPTRVELCPTHMRVITGDDAISGASIGEAS